MDRVVRALSPSKEDDIDQEQGGDGSYSIPTYTDGSENEGEADSAGAGSLHSSRRSTRPVSRAGSETHDENASPTRPLVQRHASSDKAGIKRSALSPGYFENFFHTERQLGSGGKGVVLLVRHELDGVNLGRFACKRVPVGDDHAWLEKVLIEVQLLQKLSHPNLVSYRHVWLEKAQLSRWGPSVPCAFILQEYCDAGDLLRYVVGDKEDAANTSEKLKAAMRRKSKGAREAERPNLTSSTGANDTAVGSGSGKGQKRLGFEEIYSFFRDITAGLAHLHAKNYIHRDLKPSNVLMQHLSPTEPSSSPSHLRCLISDFGEVQASSAARAATGATGTISYCAPEVLLPPPKTPGGDDLPFGNFTAKSDIFSLGMILYFMCFGRLPYVSAGKDIVEEFEDVDGLREEISGWDGYRRGKEREDLPEEVYTLLNKLLARDPRDRPTAQEILKAIEREDAERSSVPPLTAGGKGEGREKKTKRYRELQEETLSSSDKETATNRPQAARKQSALDDYDVRRHGRKSPPPSQLHGLSPRPSVSIHQEPQSPLQHLSHLEEKIVVPPLCASRALSPIPALLMPPPIPHHPVSYLITHPYHAMSLLPPRQVFLLSLSTRLALLLIRVYALATTCLPWGMNPWIIGLLVGAIFVEWSYQARGRVKRAVFATTAQFVILYGLKRQHWLCEGGYGAPNEFW